MRHLIIVITFLIFSSQAFAQTAIGDMDTATLSCGDEFIVQEDGETVWNKTTACDIVSFASAGSLSDFDLTGVADKDLLYYDNASGTWLVQNINELAAGAGSFSAVIGTSSSAAGTGATAFGYSAASADTGGSAFGFTAVASGTYSVALGANTVASGANSISIGVNSDATLGDAIAVGNSAQATGASTTVLGHSAAAGSTFATAVGYSTLANATYATAVGYDAAVEGVGGTAIGKEAVVLSTGSYGIAIGDTATVSGSTEGIAIGKSAVADQANCIALGKSANCVAANTMYLNGTTENLVADGTIQGNLSVGYAITAASTTLAATDCGTVLYFSSASDQTLTIEAEATVALPAGCNVGWGQIGDGILTVSAGSGLTFVDGNMTYSSAGNRFGSMVRFASDVILLIAGTAE